MSSEDKKLQNWMSAAHVDERPLEFQETWARAADTPAPPYNRLIVRLAAAAACVVVGVVITVSVQNRPVEYAGSDWIAPTDFLLDVPTSDWMSSTPTLYEPVELRLDFEEDQP